MGPSGVPYTGSRPGLGAGLGSFFLVNDTRSPHHFSAHICGETQGATQDLLRLLFSSGRVNNVLLSPPFLMTVVPQLTVLTLSRGETAVRLALPYLWNDKIKPKPEGSWAFRSSHFQATPCSRSGLAGGQWGKWGEGCHHSEAH